MLRNAANPTPAARECLSSPLQLASRLLSTDAGSSRPSPHRGFKPRVLDGSGPRTRATSAQPPEPERRLLSPYTLSGRLKKLCNNGDLDTAVKTLQNVPLDAQNAPVWNLIMREAVKARRTKLAYQLYIDMKRRGFSPTIKTFLTMIGGLSVIDDWPARTKQLDNIHTLFENYKDYVDRVMSQDPKSPELLVSPFSSYFKILGETQQWQKMFNIYYDMDTEGPLSPNHFVYTAMFRAIHKRGTPTGSLEAGSNIGLQNARDVKVLWRQMVKNSQKSPGFPIDSYVIMNALKVLAYGGPSEQLFAFDIIRDHLGLTKPGEEPRPAQTPLTPHVLNEVFRLCNIASKYRLCIHYFQQVRDRPLKEHQDTILDSGMMQYVLRAYTSLSAMGSLDESHQALRAVEWMLVQDVLGNSKLRPSRYIYALVLNTCWRGGDWANAARTFELITGYHAESFRDADEGGSDDPAMTQCSKGRNLQPDATAMSFLVRTALASQDQANLRQCLRMIDRVYIDSILSRAIRGPDGEDGPPLSKEAAGYAMDNQYYAARLAVDVVKLVKETSSGEAEERKKWLAIQARAKEFLRQHPLPKRTPVLEERPLGSDRGLAATEFIVDHALAKRSMKA